MGGGRTWVNNQCVVQTAQTPVQPLPIPGGTPTTDLSSQIPNCYAKGGTWNGTSCIIAVSTTTIINTPAPDYNQIVACGNSGGNWDGTRCNPKSVTTITVGATSGVSIKSGLGGNCSFNSSCQDGLSCLSGKCSDAGVSGEPKGNTCFDSFLGNSNINRACGPGLHCSSGICEEDVQPLASTNVSKNKTRGTDCGGNSECSSGSCASTYFSAGQPVFVGKPVCVPSSAEQDAGIIAKHQQDAAVVGGAAAIAYGGLILPEVASGVWSLAGGNATQLPTAAYVYGQTALTTGIASLPAAAQTAIRLGIPALNLIDDGTTGAACLAGDQNACSMVIPTIVNPIPGVGLVDSLDEAMSAFKSPLNLNRATQLNNNLFPNISSEEQAIQAAINKINNGYSLPSENVGYQTGKAIGQYNPSSLQNALDNTPDPLGLFTKLQQANSPEEAVNIALDVAAKNNIQIINQKPLVGSSFSNNWSSGFDVPITSPDATRGIAALQDNTFLSLNNESGQQFTFVSTTQEPSATVLLHPELNSLPAGAQLRTICHEIGHCVEQLLGPGDAETINSMLGVVRPNTEFISSLYGIKASLLQTQFGGVNAALDAGLTSQMYLNSNILGNPTNYFNH